MKKMILFLAVFASISIAQSKDPEVILKNVKQEFNSVKDYVVDVKIRVDVKVLKVPETQAKIYFKQPDKIHIVSEGFAMLPRKGLDFSPSSLLKDKYSAFYQKEDFVDGIKTAVVKVIPLEDNGNVILSTLWIDQSKNVIRKIESTTKTNGTYTINLDYDPNNKYPLPSSIIFEFDMSRADLVPNEFNDSQNKTGKKKNFSGMSGKVYIAYSNYIVNKGIPDSIFEEKKK
ncbi:MAG: LolA family protein [Ignavibacteriaceae bacterium]